MVDFFSGLMYTINNFMGIDLHLRGWRREFASILRLKMCSLMDLSRKIFSLESLGESCSKNSLKIDSGWMQVDMFKNFRLVC